MRCASCAKLSTDDFIFGGSRPLHASVPALKASAEAGCDLCALFWTACAQSQGEKGVANLLLGLSFDGEAVADASVVRNTRRMSVGEVQADGLRFFRWVVD